MKRLLIKWLKWATCRLEGCLVYVSRMERPRTDLETQVIEFKIVYRCSRCHQVRVPKGIVGVSFGHKADHD